MSIDDIDPSVDTKMTARLVRLFAAAGCSPTLCHACSNSIEVGDTFKLVSYEGTDEMCCAKCGERELRARDEKYQRERSARIRAGHGGFSRPSKVRS